MTLDVLAFGAHADDTELACGGTLIKLAGMGYRTGVVALTRGEMATRGSAEARAREFATAAEVMGLAVHKMLDIPDGRVEVTWENKLKIISEIRAHTPRIVIAPYWVDRHPDHENASQLVRASVYLAGLKRIETGEAFRPAKLVFARPVRVLSVVRRRYQRGPAQNERDPGLCLSIPSPDQPASEVASGETSSAGPNSDSHRGPDRLRRPDRRNTGAFSRPRSLESDDPVAFFGPDYRGRSVRAAMKICIVCYPTHGGSGVVASELAIGLAQKGHELHIVSYAPPFRLRAFHQNIFLHEVDVTLYPLFKYPPYELGLATKLVELAETCDLDIIHALRHPHAASAYHLAKQIFNSRRLGDGQRPSGTDITWG
jgi:hypothetical protein